MPSLKKYWIKEVILYLIALAIVAFPFISAIVSTGLLRRWMIALGIIGFIVYWIVSDRIMVKVEYDSLSHSQKRTVLWYRLVICTAFFALNIFIKSRIQFKLVFGALTLLMVYITIKNMVALKRRR